MEEKLLSASFTFEDFLDQLHAVQQMGSIGDLLSMIPGMGHLSRDIPDEAADKGLRTTEAIICSMTIEERRNPRLMNASRKRRIARGSGTTVQQVNQLLRQFAQMQQMMKRLGGGRQGRRGLQVPWMR
jgi:signal recognition particle subunit SRP54